MLGALSNKYGNLDFARKLINVFFVRLAPVPSRRNQFGSSSKVSSDFIDIQEILIVSTTSSVCTQTESIMFNKQNNHPSCLRKKPHVFATMFFFLFSIPALQDIHKCLRQHTTFFREAKQRLDR